MNAQAIFGLQFALSLIAWAVIAYVVLIEVVRYIAGNRVETVSIA